MTVIRRQSRRGCNVQDVFGLQVSVKDGMRQRVEISHTPGDAKANIDDERERKRVRLRRERERCMSAVLQQISITEFSSRGTSTDLVHRGMDDLIERGVHEVLQKVERGVILVDSVRLDNVLMVEFPAEAGEVKGLSYAAVPSVTNLRICASVKK